MKQAMYFLSKISQSTEWARNRGETKKQHHMAVFQQSISFKKRGLFFCKNKAKKTLHILTIN